MKRLAKILLRTLLVIFIFLNVVAAFHAYKFTHFYEPGEVTVKPAEQKGGWDKTKEALFGINFTKKVNDAVRDSAFQTVYLKTRDSLKLEAWYIPADSARGTVILFHGHGGNKSGVMAEAEGFRRMGYNTFLVDFRAHGGSEGNTCTIGVEEAEDVKLAYEYIQARKEKNIVLWGISLGAATIMKAVDEYDIKPAKLILEMPFGSLMQAVEGRLKTMGLPAQPMATLLTFWGGTEHGFWAFKHKPYLYAKKITMPVLLQWGLHDARVTKKEIDAIYGNITAPKQLVIYENTGHESLCKQENAKWMTSVSSFLKQ